jgi:hypothetical protein
VNCLECPDTCLQTEDCPGGRSFERMKSRGLLNNIRVVHLGLPGTLVRCNPTARIPDSWTPRVVPFSAIGPFMRGAIAFRLEGK